jgi:hypothetical protein
MKPRAIPEPLILLLRKQFPKLITGNMEGDNVYLLMADDKGQPDVAVHYVAGPEFMTAVRVYESGGANLEMLCGEEGFCLALAPPAREGRRRKRRES